VPVLAVDLDGVSSTQCQQCVWKLLARRHLRPVEKDREEPHAGPQPGLDLKPNEVVGVVDPSLAGPVSGVQPLLTNDDHQRVAARYPLLDDLREVVAWGDIVDVDEDPIGAKALSERICQAVSRVRSIVTTVTDEYPASTTRSRRLSLTVQTRLLQCPFPQPPEPQLLSQTAFRPSVVLTKSTDFRRIATANSSTSLGLRRLTYQLGDIDGDECERDDTLHCSQLVVSVHPRP
jgi:hypothetical protein